MRSRVAVSIVLAAGCGADEKPAPAPGPPPVATQDAGAPAPAVGPVLPDEGPWMRRRVSAIAFCPGDEELVAVDGGGWLTRWRVRDGARIGATALTADDPAGLAAGQPPPAHPASWVSDAPLARVDCRADGTALAVGVVTRDQEWSGTTIGADGKPVPLRSRRTDRVPIPFLVDRAGNRSQPTTRTDVTDSRFGAGGDPRFLVDDGIVIAVRPDGTTDTVFHSDAHYPDARLGAGDDYVEHAYPEPGMRLRRGDRWIALPGDAGYPNEVETVADGVIIAFEMSVWAWTIRDGKQAKGRELLDATGVHVKAIAAGKRWFLAVDADSGLVKLKRPGTKIDVVEHLCGDDADVTAIALSRDESRLAVACTGGPIVVRPL